MKPIRFLKIAMPAALLFFLITVTSNVKAQLALQFTTYTQKVGTTPVLNAKYLFTTVSPGYDCVVTIAELSGGAVVTNIDEPLFGAANRFQPTIQMPQTTNASCYARFTFQLITAGSYNNTTNTGTNVIPTEPIWFRAYDIDGNNAGNSIREFVELSNSFTGTWVDNPTNLVSRTPILPGGDAYIARDSLNGTNISDSGIHAFNGFIYANTASSWEVIGGSETGSAAPDLQSFDRFNSWSFIPQEVVPGIDFGDAPATYNGITTPIVPAYHIVPSIPANVKIYLGSVRPDVDYDPSGSINADVDDLNTTTDDEDGLASPFFPRYSGSGAYSVNVNVTNTSGANAYLYGYIDFNGNGNFTDANERSALITVPSSGSLQTVTVTFPAGFAYSATSIARYARFRIGSIQSEVGTSNGSAYDGEVEDYRFNTAIAISGKVFDDANGLTDNSINGAGIGNPNSKQLYAILVNANNVVVESVAVSTAAGTLGNYALLNAGTNNAYTVVLSTTAGVVGNAPPAPSLPSGWVNTGEGSTSPGDGIPSGSFAIPAGVVEYTTLNFGIDAIPVATSATLGLQLNPGSTNRISVAATSFNGSDPEDGTYATNLTGRKVNLASGTNGNVYYNGVLVPTGAGTTIPAFNPALVSFDPIDGTTTSTFTYSVFDNADKPSPAATVTIPFRQGVTIAGLIWNDVNGDANRDVAETAAIPATMYANIVNASGTVSQSILVTAGAYQSSLVFADSSYSVILTTTAQTIGNALSASSSPGTGWVYTGVNPGATSGTANTTNTTGILPVSTAGATAGIINRNFGMERTPTATGSTTSAQSNFNPYTQPVPATAFTGTDFDMGTVQNMRITAFPANAQTIVIAGIVYTAASPVWGTGGVIVPAAPSGNPLSAIAVKPNFGATSVTIPFVTIDNAGQPSPGANVIVPYYTILPATGLQLTGIRNGNDVLLKWNTLTEQNTSHFIVERSFDGRNFENIGTARASGTSNALKSYSITDRNMVKNVVYYRVYLIDADGKMTVSNTAIVRLNSFSKSNHVFPNPVSNTIYVELAGAGRYTLTLYNAAGQQLSTRQVEAASSTLTTISRNHLPSGNYVLKVLNAATKESETYKLILE